MPNFRRSHEGRISFSFMLQHFHIFSVTKWTFSYMLEKAINEILENRKELTVMYPDDKISRKSYADGKIGSALNDNEMGRKI